VQLILMGLESIIIPLKVYFIIFVDVNDVMMIYLCIIYIFRYIKIKY
jgi:hypothetical protein